MDKQPQPVLSVPAAQVEDWVRIGCGRREKAERVALVERNWLRLRGCQGA